SPQGPAVPHPDRAPRQRPIRHEDLERVLRLHRLAVHPAPAAPPLRHPALQDLPRHPGDPGADGAHLAVDHCEVHRSSAAHGGPLDGSARQDAACAAAAPGDSERAALAAPAAVSMTGPRRGGRDPPPRPHQEHPRSTWNAGRPDAYYAPGRPTTVTTSSPAENPMSTRITDTAMSSTSTDHTARRTQPTGQWRVSWLPHRLLTRNEAATAMTIAE